MPKKIKPPPKAKRRFIRRGDFHVYILRCSDGSYYTGSTNDIGRRFEQHSSGKGAKYTKCRLPVELIWTKRYRNFKAVMLEEIRIKSLTRKQKAELFAPSPRRPKKKAVRKTVKRAKKVST